MWLANRCCVFLSTHALLLTATTSQVKDLEQGHSDETEASCNAAAQHLAGIESRTSNALKYLEGVAMLKEKLSSVLSETNARA